MRKLHLLLDFCERNGTTVMLGEWGRPCGEGVELASADPRWTTSSVNHSSTSCCAASTPAFATTT